MKNIYCKSKFSFNTKYELFSDSAYSFKIGELKDDSLFSQTTGIINSSKIVFKSKGFLNSKSEIKKVELNNFVETKIGEIEFNTWRSKANVNIYNQKYNFEFSNFWNTKYRIYNDKNRYVIEGENKTTKNNISFYHDALLNEHITFVDKEITTNEINEILALTSIYINNYYVYLIVFIVLLTVIISNVANN